MVLAWLAALRHARPAPRTTSTLPCDLPELIEALPDWAWQRLLRWAGVTAASLAWLLEDDEPAEPAA